MTIEELTDKLQEITKGYTKEQFQDISFGLIRIGEEMAKVSFPHEIVKVISSKELAQLVNKETGLPLGCFTLDDYEYRIIKYEDIATILNKRGKWYNTNRPDNLWATNSHDCDNHAYKCASDINFIFEINPILVNSGAMVWKGSDGVEHRDSHKFNMAVAVDENGEIKCYLYEAQENYIAKFKDKKANRGNVDYQVYWSTAF